MVGRICPHCTGGDRVKVSENLGATSVAPVDTSLMPLPSPSASRLLRTFFKSHNFFHNGKMASFRGILGLKFQQFKSQNLSKDGTLCWGSCCSNYECLPNLISINPALWVVCCVCSVVLLQSCSTNTDFPLSKGQLISKRPFGVTKSTKKPTKI